MSGFVFFWVDFFEFWSFECERMYYLAVAGAMQARFVGVGDAEAAVGLGRFGAPHVEASVRLGVCV